MDLYLFDRDLNRLGMVENIHSLRWTRRYSRCGEFELHCAASADAINLLKISNVVYKKNDKEAGFIETRQITQDSTGQEVLVIKGRFVTAHLSLRIIWGLENQAGTPEEVIRALITNHAINPGDSDRAIDGLVLGDIAGIGGVLSTQSSYKNLLDEVENIAETHEMGIKTTIDLLNKNMVFKLYKGLDRTASNGVNPPAIFSQEFENVLQQEYMESDKDFRNTALVAGEGEGLEREIVPIVQGQGLDRREMYVDARDVKSKDSNDNPIPINDYRQLLASRGRSKLTERKEVKAFDSAVVTSGNTVYKEDFDLGDLVTVRSRKWGVTIDLRITEIEEVYEEKGFQIYVTFGDGAPTLIDKIRQEVR